MSQLGGGSRCGVFDILGLTIAITFETYVGLVFVFFWWNLLYLNFYLFFGWFHPFIRLVLDLAWFSINETFPYPNFYLFFGCQFDGLGFVLVSHDLPHLRPKWCRLDFAISSWCLSYLHSLSYECGLCGHFLYTPLLVYSFGGHLGEHFFYTSTPSFGRNSMNLVLKDLVLFRLFFEEFNCKIVQVYKGFFC